MPIEMGGRAVVDGDRALGGTAEDRGRLFDEAFPLEKRRAILGALAEKALSGDVRVAAFLFDRVYGRPTVAPAPETSQSADSERVDLGRLDDWEIDTLVGLFRKARELDHEPGELCGGGGGAAAQALPRRPGSVCEGGA